MSYKIPKNINVEYGQDVKKVNKCYVTPESETKSILSYAKNNKGVIRESKKTLIPNAGIKLIRINNTFFKERHKQMCSVLVKFPSIEESYELTIPINNLIPIMNLHLENNYEFELVVFYQGSQTELIVKPTE